MFKRKKWKVMKPANLKEHQGGSHIAFLARPQGEWEIYTVAPFDGEDCRCSECGKTGCAPYWDYCPHCGTRMLASKVDGYVGEYNAVINAVNVIKNFLDKYGAEAGSSYWKSNIDDETLVTDWGYVEEGLELLKGYCLKLAKGADDEA